MLVQYRISSSWWIKKRTVEIRSVNNIVIPAAKTGRDKSNKTAVTKTAQTNKGIIFMRSPGTLILTTVTKKLIAPKIEEIPAKCKLKIARSTELSEVIADKGGYKVQPVPTPPPTKLDINNKVKEGGSSQKLKLLSEEKPYQVHQPLKAKINYQNRLSWQALPWKKS
jgi:hypothetical protein